MKVKFLKLAVLFVLAGCCVPQAAQAGWFTGGGNAVKAVRTIKPPRLPLNAAVGRQVSRAFPRTVNAFSVSSAAVERYIFSTVSPTAPGKLPFVWNDEDTPYSWLQETKEQYNRFAEEFKAFKKEADAVLYYQSKASESRTLHTEELSRWRAKIDETAQSLSKIRHRVDGDDPFLTFADEYLTYARWSLYPHAQDIYFVKPVAPRLDRTFSADEFFLRLPDDESRFWESSSARSKRISAQLPSGLRVAVVNDLPFTREQVKNLHRQELLFPDGVVHVFSSADEVLRQMSERSQTYDVIFTDIIISGGGGGYYLASELRQNGYNGVIIALSSYEESEELGLKMFERGLDGMIRLAGGAEYKRGWSADLMQKLLNYYRYRDLNGWIH